MKLCPKCNSKLIIKDVGRDHIVRCSKCDYEITTTNSSAMDFDGTIYELFIKSENEPTLDNIKFISRTSGVNFNEAKRILIQGGFYFKGYAIEIMSKRELLDSNGINYQITPKFPY
jgi:DNA-directed RNA polymerase subunit M/transcription elongation factor TFIIS